MAIQLIMISSVEQLNANKYMHMLNRITLLNCYGRKLCVADVCDSVLDVFL